MIQSVTLQLSDIFMQISLANGDYAILKLWQAIIAFILPVFFAITVYVLMGVGLSKMAKNRGMKKAYLGYVPFARWYLLGNLAGECRIFGKKIKNLGIFAMILSIVSFVLTAYITLIDYLPIATVLLRGETVEFTFNELGEAIPNFSYEYNAAIQVIYYIVDVLETVAGLLELFVLINLYLVFYKQYSPMHHMLFMIISIFTPGAGIIIFALRNKKVINFGDFIKERMKKMQGMYGNPYGAPFNDVDRKQSTTGEPFGEFASDDDKKDEPFSEFDKKDE